MIISKTPFRISFFGGGTDFPDYYNKYGGKVIGGSIDKYCYISIRELPPFFNHKYRFVWSKIENLSSTAQSSHPAFKAIFKYFKIKTGMEIHYDGDLPSRSGIGSSSSFTIGLINCLNLHLNKKKNKKKLSEQGIFLEQKILKEQVGSQDQVWSSFGGFNKISFNKNKIKVKKNILNDEKLVKLEKNLILFFTGKTRIANNIEKTKIKNIDKKIEHYHKIKTYVDECERLLKNNEFDNFGRLLDEYWFLKKKLSKGVSNILINELYSEAKFCGSLGGKILGAGGGGFIMFYGNKSVQNRLKKRFSKLTYLKFKFEKEGSQIILNK